MTDEVSYCVDCDTYYISQCRCESPIPTTRSARVEYELQYLNHAGTWQSGSFEQDEDAARNLFKAMTERFPRQHYRLIRRTAVDEIISQSK